MGKHHILHIIAFLSENLLDAAAGFGIDPGDLLLVTDFRHFLHQVVHGVLHTGDGSHQTDFIDHRKGVTCLNILTVGYQKFRDFDSVGQPDLASIFRRKGTAAIKGGGKGTSFYTAGKDTGFRAGCFLGRACQQRHQG